VRGKAKGRPEERPMSDYLMLLRRKTYFFLRHDAKPNAQIPMPSRITWLHTLPRMCLHAVRPPRTLEKRIRRSISLKMLPVPLFFSRFSEYLISPSCPMTQADYRGIAGAEQSTFLIVLDSGYLIVKTTNSPVSPIMAKAPAYIPEVIAARSFSPIRVKPSAE